MEILCLIGGLVLGARGDVRADGESFQPARG